MRTRGLARTTTKEIALASGFSEGMLYELLLDLEVLDLHRRGVQAQQTGPAIVVEHVKEYLHAEQAIGRVVPGAPIGGAARAIVGASFWRAFVAHFENPRGDGSEGAEGGNGDGSAPDDGCEFAKAIVVPVLPGPAPTTFAE